MTLRPLGFRIRGAQIVELGPGDSIGVGLVALRWSGALVGLDVLPLFVKADLESILDELVRLYARKEPIPDNDEFLRVRPYLESYEFPDRAIEWTGFGERAELIRSEIRKSLDDGQMVTYRAPWTSIAEVAPNLLDLLFSQAVLEYVVRLEDTYRAMSMWLKPGRYAPTLSTLVPIIYRLFGTVTGPMLI